MADKIRLPASEGGLVRYYDTEYKSVNVLKPEVVVGICIAVIVLGIILAAFGAKWLGI